MNDNLNENSAHYDALMQRQIDQYKNTEVMHNLPPIYDYWTKAHFSDRVKQVIGYADPVHMYAEYFIKSLNESGTNTLLSIGSGDCLIEIEVAKYLIAKGYDEFTFICLELSPILIEKANKKIKEENLDSKFKVEQKDINSWIPDTNFAGVMVHHALHHFLDLELLFERIKKSLAPRGRFITSDIIGRNGHMRWPEILVLLRKIWSRLPRRYKYNHQFQKFDDYYDNWDCSNEGFEGIRAEDILPLLIDNFSFEVFFCYGGLTDPFLDRGFGPNYSVNSPEDCAFINYLHNTNEELISRGIFKPTAMAAVLMNEKVETSIYQNWTPEFVKRDPKAAAPIYDVERYLDKMPLKASEEDDPRYIHRHPDYILGTTLFYTTKLEAKGPQTLTYGWCPPEESFTWSCCESAGLNFFFKEIIRADLRMKIEYIPYKTTLGNQTVINIYVNGVNIGSDEINNEKDHGVRSVEVKIPSKLIADSPCIEVMLEFPNRRAPQYESGDDVRGLGIALISAQIFK